MPVLVSNRAGTSTGLDIFYKKFDSLVASHVEITIATGFVSVDSLVHMIGLIRQNPKSFKSLNVYIGMGLRGRQRAAADVLDAELGTRHLGGVYVVRQWPFHGKIYLYGNGGNLTAATIGSSNLDAILSQHQHVELDLLTSESSILAELGGFVDNTLDPASVSLSKVATQPGPIGPVGPSGQVLNYQTDISDDRLDVLQGVSKISSSEMLAVLAALSGKDFFHKLKTHKKSNLNVFHGKGRLNRRPDKSTYINPRAWYEIEIILSQSEREDPNAPPSGDFTVVTDDGWQFDLRRQGDYGKNIRSLSDLRALGKWLKGRLEDSGALKPSELVTDSTLGEYGRDNIRFTPIQDGSGRWYIDFSSP